MPSNARKLFRDKLLPDVASLDDTHRHVNPDGHGRRALGHLTRSGVIMLCAAWELYIEEVILESVDFLVRDAETPGFLPNSIQGRIAQAAKNDKHALGALKLCGLGWKEVYREAVRFETDRLNTPKFGTVDQLFSKWLAIAEVDNHWRHGKEELNQFVTMRGEIAHRGADAKYVRITELRRLKSLVDDIVVDTDRALGEHLKGISLGTKKPWRN